MKKNILKSIFETVDKELSWYVPISKKEKSILRKTIKSGDLLQPKSSVDMFRLWDLGWTLYTTHDQNEFDPVKITSLVDAIERGGVTFSEVYALNTKNDTPSSDIKTNDGEIIFGVYDRYHQVKLKGAPRSSTHEILFPSDANHPFSTMFRYLPNDGFVYWWDMTDEEVKNRVHDKLERGGFKVYGDRIISDYKSKEYKISHEQLVSNIERLLLEKKNSTLLVTDIQPEYSKYIHFDISQFCNFLNTFSKKGGKIIVLFNGPSLDMTTEEELHHWYLENGLSEDIDLQFFDKGYAFFRYCMDSGIDEDDIVNLGKFMVENEVYDSRSIEKKLWDVFSDKYNSKEIRELLEFSGDMIHIPELVDFIDGLGDNILLIGGGRTECLREVEIALKIKNKKYQLIDRWIY